MLKSWLVGSCYRSRDTRVTKKFCTGLQQIETLKACNTNRCFFIFFFLFTRLSRDGATEVIIIQKCKQDTESGSILKHRWGLEKWSRGLTVGLEAWAVCEKVSTSCAENWVGNGPGTAVKSTEHWTWTYWKTACHVFMAWLQGMTHGPEGGDVLGWNEEHNGVDTPRDPNKRKAALGQRSAGERDPPSQRVCRGKLGRWRWRRWLQVEGMQWQQHRGVKLKGCLGNGKGLPQKTKVSVARETLPWRTYHPACSRKHSMWKSI